LARIGGLLRRTQWLRGPADRYTFAGRTIDFDALELTVDDRVLHLTLMEANLLRFLIGREGKAVSRKEVLEQVWGLHEDTDTRAIDNFLVRLRRYIEPDPSRPRHLVPVRGVAAHRPRSQRHHRARDRLGAGRPAALDRGERDDAGCGGAGVGAGADAGRSAARHAGVQPVPAHVIARRESDHAGGDAARSVRLRLEPDAGAR